MLPSMGFLHYTSFDLNCCRLLSNKHVLSRSRTWLQQIADSTVSTQQSVQLSMQSEADVLIVFRIYRNYTPVDI